MSYEKKWLTNKKAVYIVHWNGGGVDGRDSSDKPNDIYASLVENEAIAVAEKSWGQNCTINAKLIDLEDAKAKLKAKLTPIDLMLIRDFRNELI